jgi:hypothetical protein
VPALTLDLGSRLGRAIAKPNTSLNEELGFVTSTQPTYNKELGFVISTQPTYNQELGFVTSTQPTDYYRLLIFLGVASATVP